MKKILNNKLLLLLIITIFLLLFSFGTNAYLKHITINEQKELTAPANWYEDYTYTLDETNHTITLNKYNGSASEVVIGSTATIGGVTYSTIVVGGTASSALYANNTTITKVTFENGIKAGTTLQYLFRECQNLKEINFNDFDTSATTNMRGMFYNCDGLTSLDLSNFNTSNVTTFAEMFYLCNNLAEVNLSSFNTSNATTLYRMFMGARKLKKIDLSNFDTSNVTNYISMFHNANSLQELDISNFDMSSVDEGGLRNFAHSAGYIKKFKIGPKTAFHIHDSKMGAAFIRGTLTRLEDGTEIKAIDLFERSDTENMAGTYVFKSNISSDMNIDFQADYKINNINRNAITSTSNSSLFEYINGILYIKDMPIPTEADHHLDEFFEFLIEDAVEDARGNKYDLKVRFDNFWFYDFNTYTDIEKVTLEIASFSISGRIALCTYALDSINGKSVDEHDTKYDVTIEIMNKDGSAANGNYIFSMYDMDIGSYRDTLEEYNPEMTGFGDYSEGINLIAGFDSSSIIMHPNTYLVKRGNRINGSRSDEATELSELIIKASAKKTKFSWTGKGCATSMFSYYQPRTVDIVKKSQRGAILPRAKLELYKNGSTTPFTTWTSGPEAEHIFLNPGAYILKEAEAPTGFNKASDITFYADINNTLTIEGKNVDEVVMVDEPAEYHYKINYYQKGNTNGLLDSYSGVAKFGDVLPASDFIKEISLFTYDSSSTNNLLITHHEKSNVLNLYYVRKKATLVVRYVDENGNNIDALKNRIEIVNYGDRYSTTKYEFDNYDFVNVTGDEPNGSINKDNYEIIYHYKLKQGTVTTHHYLYNGRETTTKLADDVTETWDYTKTYNTSISSAVPDNYELYKKTPNYTGIMNSPSVEVIYYYQLKDSDLALSISKTGPTEITDKNATFDYNIHYGISIGEYIGNAKITIVDTLPKKIDVSKSNLKGGTYNEDSNTITWVISKNNINTYESSSGIYTVSADINISVKYTDIVGTDRILINSVKGKIELSNNERELEEQTSTNIKIPGKITIRYVDKDDKDLVEKQEETDLVGEALKTKEKEIKGYKIVSKPVQETITFTEEPQEIKYVYERIKVNVKTRVDGKGGTVKGDESIYYGDDSTKDSITIKADKGYVISEILINDEKIDIEPNLEELVLDNFKEVTEDKEVVVRFKEKEPDNPDTSLLTFKNIMILIILLIIVFIYLEFKTNKKIYRI